MNEWRRLLEQTQYQNKPVSGTLSADFVDENEELVTKVDVSEGAGQASSESVEETTPLSLDLDWISPTAKLQKKIENIPDKFGFKIGEAADYVGVKQYVLRYWESEFDRLKPKKSKNGQRMYTKKDVETALLIQKLLHDDRFSIEGARSALTQLKKQVRETVKAQKEASKFSSNSIAAANGTVSKKQPECKAIESQAEAVQAITNLPKADIDPRTLNEAVASAERLLENIRKTREDLQL